MSALSPRHPWVGVGRPSGQLRAAEPRGQGVSLLSQQVGGHPAANSYGKGMSCCPPVPQPACMCVPIWELLPCFSHGGNEAKLPAHSHPSPEKARDVLRLCVPFPWFVQ